MAVRKQRWQCSSELEELDLARSVLLRPNLPTHWCIFWTETDIHNFKKIIYSLNARTIIEPLQWLWTTGLQYSKHRRHRWLSALDGQSDSCFNFGYCITQVRNIVSVCSNPLPPFLWTLLKRSQTLTLYFDRAKGRFYYLSRGWQVVTRLAHRHLEVYGPLYWNVSAGTWPCS